MPIIYIKCFAFTKLHLKKFLNIQGSDKIKTNQSTYVKVYLYFKALYYT